MNLTKIEKDKVFLTDQCSERKYVMGGVDTDLAKQEKCKESSTEENSAAFERRGAGHLLREDYQE